MSGILRLLVASLALIASAAPARAVPDDPVVTQHEIRIAGQELHYTAEAGRIAIRDVETGEPHGFMFYVAYRVAPTHGPRPVTFVWNGGPGANSSTLHFETAGPMREEGARLVANDDSWLTATDLVFVDPVGTGFSRPARADYADEFYGTVGDVASVTEFVRVWRILHGAEENPLYLVGESWGAGRAASVGYALLKRGIDVDGLVLISGGAGLPDVKAIGDIAAFRIVNLAANAFYHRKLAPDVGDSVEAVRAAAEAWVRSTYVPALHRIANLTAAERDAIASGLARYTGLPTESIDRATLTIPPRQFRTELVGGKTLDPFDMRLTGAAPTDAVAAMLRYFRHDLGYLTALPYLGLELAEMGYAPDGDYPAPVGERWDYATTRVSPEQRAAAIAEAVRTGAGPPVLGPPLPATAEAVALSPELRILVASGLYDSFANCAGYERLDHVLPAPLRSAIEFRCYTNGGHMMYRDAGTRAEFAEDIRAFVTPPVR